MKKILFLLPLLLCLLASSCGEPTKPALTKVDAVEATCTKNGNIACYKDESGNFYADADGNTPIAKADVAVKATGHDFSKHEQDSDDEGYHLIVCAICGEKEEEAHEMSTEVDGKTYTTACEICGKVTAKLTLVEATAAGCEDGNVAYFKDGNGNFYTDKAGRVKITDKESVVIKGKGHRVSPILESDDEKHYFLCLNCGKHFSEHTHNAVTTDAVLAGRVTQGHSAGTWCEACGHTFTDMTFTKSVTGFISKVSDKGLHYCIYQPDDAEESKTKLPLVIFLHGSGERYNPDDPSTAGVQLTDASVLAICNQGLDTPFMKAVVIAPQCDKKEPWVNPQAAYPETNWDCNNYKLADVPESESLKKVVSLVEQYRELPYIDENRVYVMGLSMGGFGTWDLLARHGELFAAGVPMCGNGPTDPEAIAALKDIPIFTFHCADDSVVLCSGTEEMVELITRAGGKKILFKKFPSGAHHAWEPALAFKGDDTLPAMAEWLFGQRKN